VPRRQQVSVSAPSYTAAHTQRLHVGQAVQLVPTQFSARQGNLYSYIVGKSRILELQTAHAVRNSKIRELPQKTVHSTEAIEKDDKKVALVGDGVNASPALTRADVGIALSGGAGVQLSRLA
jgi:hypothetical protein